MLCNRAAGFSSKGQRCNGNHCQVWGWVGEEEECSMCLQVHLHRTACPSHASRPLSPQGLQNARKGHAGLQLQAMTLSLRSPIMDPPTPHVYTRHGSWIMTPDELGAPRSASHGGPHRAEL
ncbi:hypothetical protein NDU88_002657 [Pleurodeles waltl]|uniref:Uncharacterized protein n=1 Tax=Pleurodeles waltl TaxID=8319 RepID=A0AAV7KUT9_PLEWA|nr:hypothetical protein NDU88_002657 [Pleurodeles waltl]